VLAANFLKKYIKGIVLLSLILFIYIPFALQGGYGPSDDLNLILQAKDIGSSWDFFLKRMSEGADYTRPVSWIFTTTVLVNFGNNPELYIITSIIIWILSVAIIRTTVKELFGKSAASLFLIIAIFPFFSPTFLFNAPSYLAQYEFPILFFGLSLLFIHRYTISRSQASYFLAYFAITLSILSLSIVLPLLIIIMLFPIVRDASINNKGEYNIRELLIRYVLPIIVIGIIFIIYKKIGSEYIMAMQGEMYGVSQFNTNSLLQALYYFIALVVELPLMLLELIPHLFSWRAVFIAALVATYFFLIRIEFYQEIKTYESKFKDSKNIKYYLAVIILSLGAVSLIFLISGYPATTFGFYSKMLTPAFILISMLLGIFGVKYIIKKQYVFLCAVVFFGIYALDVQLQNFIKSWEIRENIVTDIVKNLKNIDLGENPVLIANIPYFLKNNYNNEEVTFTTWAFEDHLKLSGSPKIQAWPVSYRIVSDPSFYPNHNLLNKISLITNNANLWYYEYLEGNDTSKFYRIDDKQALLKKFDEIKEKRINYHPIILREKIRLLLIKLLSSIGIERVKN
jgi:hypothetical protein